MSLSRDDIATAYEAHGAAIYAYCLRKLGDADDAGDVAAAVWEEALRLAPRYVDRGYPVRAWIYRIARSRCIDLVRQRQRRQRLPLAEDHATVDPPTPPMDLRSLFPLLTGPQLRALLLAADGLSGEEIAEALGITPGAVKALLHRARTRVRATMDRDLAPLPRGGVIVFGVIA